MSSPRPKKKRKPSLQRAPAAPRYEFTTLLHNNADLRRYATASTNGQLKLDLSSREATYALTRAILCDHFSLRFTLPQGQLVPTVPNRVQYLTWATELLGLQAREVQRVVVDIGTGPSCIYALLGTRLFPEWSFVATDTDPVAIESARRNVEDNDLGKVTVLLTLSEGKLLPSEIASLKPSLTVCNPPFHAELPDTAAPAGSQSQLVTEGGEYAFVCRLADESTQLPSIEWFTSLVGRKVDLPRIVAYLRSSRVRALYVKTVELSQGGRTTRWAVAWSFGQERSQVSFVDDHGSKWRHVLSVRPGRKFANQLSVDDIAATFSSVFNELKWVEDDELNGEQSSIVFRGPEESPLSETVLHMHVTEGTASNDFLVHLKVRDRGEMPIAEFNDLGSKLVKAVSDVLNDGYD